MGCLEFKSKKLYAYDISKTQNPIQSYFRVNEPPPQNNRESFSFHSDSRSIDIFKLCASKISLENRNLDFNTGWKFKRDSVIQAASLDFDDSDWRTIDLPHDFSIEDLPGEDSGDQIGPFLKSLPGARSEGYLPGGTAWYRKHFTLENAANKTVIGSLTV